MVGAGDALFALRAAQGGLALGKRRRVHNGVEERPRALRLFGGSARLGRIWRRAARLAQRLSKRGRCVRMDWRRVLIGRLRRHCVRPRAAVAQLAVYPSPVVQLVVEAARVAQEDAGRGAAPPAGRRGRSAVGAEAAAGRGRRARRAWGARAGGHWDEEAPERAARRQRPAAVVCWAPGRRLRAPGPGVGRGDVVHELRRRGVAHEAAGQDGGHLRLLGRRLCGALQKLVKRWERRALLPRHQISGNPESDGPAGVPSLLPDP